MKRKYIGPKTSVCDINGEDDLLLVASINNSYSEEPQLSDTNNVWSEEEGNEDINNSIW